MSVQQWRCSCGRQATVLQDGTTHGGGSSGDVPVSGRPLYWRQQAAFPGSVQAAVRAGVEAVATGVTDTSCIFSEARPHST